jgi:hypothetical protein
MCLVNTVTKEVSEPLIHTILLEYKRRLSFDFGTLCTFSLARAHNKLYLKKSYLNRMIQQWTEETYQMWESLFQIKSLYS